MTIPLVGSLAAVEWICALLTMKQEVLNKSDQKSFTSGLHRLPLNITIHRPPLHAHADITANAPPIECGPIIDYCIATYWKCKQYSWLCDGCVVDGDGVKEVVCACLDCLDVIGDQLCIPLSCMATIVPNV